MGGFNRWIIPWLIFIVYFLSGCITVSTDIIKLSPDTLRSSKFDHLTVHQREGTLFISVGNRLYKYSQDLKMLANVSTTFSTNIMNMLINYENSELIACGDTGNYWCQTYNSIDNTSSLSQSKVILINEVKNFTNATILAFIGNNDQDKNNDWMSKLYFAISYSENDVENTALFAKTFVKNEKESLSVDTDSVTNNLNDYYTKYRNKYKVNYVYGFSSGKYNYILTTQQNSTTNGSSYISKLIRICDNNNSLLQGYTEIPIECKNDRKISYNLVQAANVAKPNLRLAKSLNITSNDDVLFGLFSKSQGGKALNNKPINQSVVCIYSLKAIDEKFNENIQNCVNRNGYGGFNTTILKQQCTGINENIDSDFCSSKVNMPLVGNIPLTTSSCAMFSTLPTAIAIKTDDSYNDLFFGTNIGSVIHVVMKNGTDVCIESDLQIDEGSPVNSDLLFSPDKNYLYAMTENHLQILKTPQDSICSQYIDYNACFRNSSSRCGWCAFTNKCTIRCECFYNYTFDLWFWSDFRKGIIIVGNSSLEFQIGAARTIHLIIKAFPKIRDQLLCLFHFANGKSLSTTGKLIQIYTYINLSCEMPETPEISVLLGKGNYLNSILTINTTHIPDIMKMNVTFFDCKTYTSCKECVSTKFSCTWHPKEKKCSHGAIHNSAINNSPEFESNMIIHSKRHAVIEFPNMKSYNVCETETNLKCLISIEGNEFMKNVAIKNGSYFCKNTTYKYTRKTMNTTATVSITWKTPYKPYLLSTKNVFIYNCEQMAHNFNSCLTLDEKYKCGWCQGPNACKFQDDCDDQSIEDHTTSSSSSRPTNDDPVTPKPNIKSVDPKILGISPTSGPIYGGTVLTIKGENLNIGKLIRVFIGDVLCLIFSLTSEEIKCVTNSSTEMNATVHVKSDDNVSNFSQTLFAYVRDLQRDDKGFNIQPKGIPAGGVTILVHVDPLDFEQELFFQLDTESRVYKSPCELQTDSTLYCSSPYIPDIPNHLIDAENPQKMKYSIRNNATNESITLSKKQESEFLLYPNPEFYDFLNTIVEIDENKFVIIRGKNIDKACQKTDIIVKAGNHTCEVKSISSNQLVCLLSSSPTPDCMDDSENNNEILAEYDEITVIIGDHFSVTVPKQSSSTAETPKTKFLHYVVIILIIISILSIISIAFLCLISKKKVTKTVKKLKNTQLQMTKLELRVASECKEAFAELQTQKAAFKVNDSYPHLPFLNYHNYIINILFPNLNDHSFILNGKAILIHKEKGLRLFEELIMNRRFLLTFVRTLENQRSFSMNDRVHVASMIMITLQKDMVYCTDILKTLLAELIEKNMRGNSHPKLLLRRTESIVEKMLSTWLSFLLYKFLKKSAGQPLFNLFNAIKENINRGPVDMITSHARYCLSDNKILRLKFDYRPLTIYVTISQHTAKIIDLESAVEKIPVQALDCDTISQFKDKAVDAIHRKINFTRIINPSELNVKWFRDTASRFILSDDDSTSMIEGEWRRKNTLKHYNVPDGSDLNLISDREINYQSLGIVPVWNKNELKNNIKLKSAMSMRATRKNSLTESTTALIPANDLHFKEWHLIRPFDSQDDKLDRNENHEMMPEIYLTRLLSTKSSLQRFVDEMFNIIFKKTKQSGCFPIAIKYIFDFLDDQARQYNITDPEVVHVWKNNCLPLRFWVNLIKNPNFLFDVHKSNVVDSCLSVIAQVFMDSCSISEQHFNKDSAATKLLYAKEIPIYNKLVKKYYADIKSMPRISPQEMNAILAEVSEKCSTDFDANMPIHELFKYATKYKEELIDALKNDEFSKDNLLVLTLEEVMEIISTVSNL